MPEIILVSRLTSRNSSPWHQNCTLLTPGVIEELRGQFAIAKFWTILVETFPDAIVEVSEGAWLCSSKPPDGPLMTPCSFPQVISITPEDEQGDKIDLHWRFRGTQIDQLPADRIIRTVIVKKNKGQTATTDQISLSGEKGHFVVMLAAPVQPHGR